MIRPGKIKLSHCPRGIVAGQWDTNPETRDSKWDSGGTIDLKALALQVLQRDSEWDKCGTETEKSVPTTFEEKDSRGTVSQEQEAPGLAYPGVVTQAMLRIELVCPPGALKWAREAHPTLTDKIDLELIPRLNELWNAHAPLPDFEAALEELVRVHTEVGRLFREQVA